MRFVRATAVLLVLLVAPCLTSAQTIDPAATVLTSIFTAKTVDAAALSPSFTASVPVTALQSIVDDTRARLGALASVRRSGTDYALAFARGTMLATISLDATGKVNGLLFHDETSPANRKALERLFAAKTLSADWFTPAFLAQVPLAQMTAILAQQSAAGGFVRLDERDGAYYAVFEKAEQHVLVSTDTAGRVTFLFLRPLAARTSDPRSP